MADNQVTSSDVESLGNKLVEFSKTLTPAERIILIERLKQAPADEDVQGYYMPGYLSQKLAETHRYELLREAEQERLTAASGSSQPWRQRNVVRLAVAKMGAMLVNLGTRMRQMELQGRPVTQPL